MNRISGRLNAGGRRYALVMSRTNELITEALLKGAVEELVRLGADKDDMTVVEVPGAFEMPGVARRLAAMDRYDVIICIGAVIRGGTPHFDFVAGACTRGLAQLAQVVWGQARIVGHGGTRHAARGHRQKVLGSCEGRHGHAHQEAVVQRNDAPFGVGQLVAGAHDAQRMMEGRKRAFINEKDRRRQK